MLAKIYPALACKSWVIKNHSGVRAEGHAIVQRTIDMNCLRVPNASDCPTLKHARRIHALNFMPAFDS